MNNAMYKPVCLAFLAILINGCKPSYLERDISAAIREISLKEYGLAPEIKIAGQTINVWLPVKNLTSELTNNSSQVLENLGNVMLVISRVTISSEDNLKFFVLSAYDPEHPQLELGLTRYIRDIKRYILEDISRDEFLESLVISISFTAGDTSFELTTDIQDWNLEVTSLLSKLLDNTASNSANTEKTPAAKEVKMHDFIAKVAAKYIERVLTKNKAIGSLYTIANVNAKWGDDTLKVSFQATSKATDKDRAYSIQESIKKHGLTGAMIGAANNAVKNMLDLFRSKPTVRRDILPYSSKQLSKLLRRYNVSGPVAITVMEQNSKQSLSVKFDGH